MASKIPARSLNQCSVLVELEEAIREFRPKLFEGYFYTSNRSAFKIAFDTKSGELTDLKIEWLEAVNEAMDDLLVITSSARNSVKTLADLELTLNEIFEDIQSYDNLSE
jgi:hypothetical protein